MNSFIHRFTLNMHSVQSQISIPVLRGDTCREFHVNLSDGGNSYIIEDGCLAKISIKRPTGTSLEDFCSIEKNTTIVYKFEQNVNTAAVEGIHNCEIVLYGLDGRQIASPKFTMVVSELAVRGDDDKLSDEDFNAVHAMVLRETARQAAEVDRKSAENERATAEALRCEAEKQRASAEEDRINAGKLALASAEAAKVSETNALSYSNASHAWSNKSKEYADNAETFADAAKEAANATKVYATTYHEMHGDILKSMYGSEDGAILYIPDKGYAYNLESGITGHNSETLRAMFFRDAQVHQINGHTFNGCSKLSYIDKFPSTLYDIHGSAFAYCGFSSIEIDCVNIQNRAFRNNPNLTTVVISDRVEQIYEYAFFECRRLTYVKIGKNVQKIGTGAFKNCITDGDTSTLVVDMTGVINVPTLEDPDSFPWTVEIRVASGRREDFVAETNWSTWSSNIVEV